MRTILIADKDPSLHRELRNSLGEWNKVLLASNGTDGFEIATSVNPDLILYEHRCPLIGLEEFLRAAETIPKMREIKVVALFESALEAREFASPLSERIVERWIKPLDPNVVRSKVASLLDSFVVGGSAGSPDEIVSGSLEQISSTDLLQIFSVNRRTGSLRLVEDTEGLEAEIYLDNGAITEAVLGRVVGTKAFHRIMGWSQGHFEFHPHERIEQASISGSTDRLLMNALRELDELEKVKGDIPKLNDRVSYLSGKEGAEIPHLSEIERQVFDFIGSTDRVGSLADQVAATDLVFFQALLSLCDKGLIEVQASEVQEIRNSLTSEELADFVYKLGLASFAPSFRKSPKIAIFTSSRAELSLVQESLAELPRFRPARSGGAGAMGFGTLGSVFVDADLRLELMGFVTELSTLPIAGAVLEGSVLAMAMRSKDAAKKEILKQYLRFTKDQLRIPIVEIRAEQLARADRVLAAAIRTVVRSGCN